MLSMMRRFAFDRSKVTNTGRILTRQLVTNSAAIAIRIDVLMSAAVR